MSERLVPRVYNKLPVVEVTSPRMRVLAIDPGSSLGWYCEGEGGFHDFRDNRSSLHRTDRHGLLFERAGDRVADLITQTRPGIIVLEAVVGVMRGEAAPILFGLRAIILAVARRREVMIDEVNRSAWQKWAAPRGWIKGTDQNDAMHLWQFYVAERLPEIAVGAAA